MWFDSEAKLIEKAQQGHQAAVTKLMKKHQSALFQHLVRLMGNSADAQDVMQETWLSVLRSIGSFRGESSFKLWLFKIAQFRAMDAFRKRKVVHPWSVEEDERICEVQSQCSIEQQLARGDVIAALKQLPFEQRIVIELKFFQQLTFSEMAEQLAESENTIKSRFYSALKTMRPALEARHG